MIKKGLTHRRQRVAFLVNQALIEVLQRGGKLDVKLLSNPLTITKVEMSANLKVAFCYFLPFNTSFTIKELLTALDNSKYAIRSYVTEKIALKFSPEIVFEYDQVYAESERIQQLIRLNKQD